MRKEEDRKTKQKRRVVNAAPEQENEITQKSGWRSCWDGDGDRDRTQPWQGTGLAQPGTVRGVGRVLWSPGLAWELAGEGR